MLPSTVITEAGPFVASITHPLFGTVGVEDEDELALVGGAMHYLTVTPEPDYFTPHAALPTVDTTGDTAAI